MASSSSTSTPASGTGPSQPVASASKPTSGPTQIARRVGCSGTTFGVFFAPPGPFSVWELRLRDRLGRCGSVVSDLIWKVQTTPSGRSLSSLQALMLRTTSVCRDGSPSLSEQTAASTLAFWPSPTARDSRKGTRGLHRGLRDLAMAWYAPTDERDSVNPVFAADLLDLPRSWLEHVPTLQHERRFRTIESYAPSERSPTSDS